MAIRKKDEPAETTVEESAVQPKKTAVKTNEPSYGVKELAAAYKTVFDGIMPECIIAAFAVSGKTKATISEAKEIVKKYMNTEVK